VPSPTRRFLAPVLQFLRTEAAGGVALVAAVAVALAWANGPWAHGYEALWGFHVSVGTPGLALDESLRGWVNDGLMVVFFFVVGVEFKRELVHGELRDPRTAAVPVLAALGGMVVPALVFTAWTAGRTGGHGWGIPMATDIALVVGVLAILGTRAPPKLRVFLLTLAVVDDIGAIVVIAVFYAGALSWSWLGGAVAGVAVVVLMRPFVRAPVAYVPIAIAVWVATLNSGVHATIAGVALGLLTPAGEIGGREVLEELEARLHPWTSFFVIPVFALANAGIALDAHAVGASLTHAVGLGVFTGLVVGKPVGVIGATFLATACGLRLPEGVRRAHVVGAGLLAGIGFTVSLFVADLAFPGSALLGHAKIAIFAASCTAAIVGIGALVLVRSPSVRVVALVDDLMDRSRLGSALPDVTYARTAAECAGADVVVVDLDRHGGDVTAVRDVVPGARVVGFFSHVDRDTAERAIGDGADVVLARSRFFHDPAQAIES
jgi:NhaA family Na+:H+ antiporter